MSEPENKDHKAQVHIDISEEQERGAYSNLVILNYNQEEFVLDFAFLQPQAPKGKILARTILSPRNAKRFSALLETHIKSYEEKFGPISEGPENPQVKFSVN